MVEVYLLYVPFFSFYQFTRCLTIDGIRLQTETVGAAIKTVTKTEDGDTGTEDRRRIPPAVTERERGTEGGEGTGKKEAMHAQGGVCVDGGVGTSIPFLNTFLQFQ